MRDNFVGDAFPVESWVTSARRELAAAELRISGT